MKIKKPQTTISNFEFSDPNEAGTVAFFDPTVKDDRGSFAVVRKEDAQLIQAAEDMQDGLITCCLIIDALLNYEPIRRRFDKPTQEFYNETINKSTNALKQAGCEVSNDED